MRYVARQWAETDGVPHLVGAWGVFDLAGECLFGDNMPRDKREAEQCARAANAAIGDFQDAMLERLRKAIYQ